MIRPILCSSLTLFLLKISSAVVLDSDCDGFLLDSNCYKVIMQPDDADYRSFSSSSDYASSVPESDFAESSWSEAKDQCEENGANLASLPNIRVQSILAYYLKDVYPETSLFIGLRRKKNDDVWRWAGTGNSTEYNNWNTQELQPTVMKSVCAGVYMDTNDSLWYDTRCAVTIFLTERTRIGALCQSEISPDKDAEPIGLTSAPVPVQVPQCHENIFAAVSVGQAVFNIVLLLTLALYCKKRKCTATEENQTSGHSWPLNMTVHSRTANEDASNTYDVPRNTIVTEDEYEVCSQVPVPNNNKHANPTYDSTAMDEHDYMEPMVRPSQSEYKELDLRH